jgi:hypothetical protein
MHQNRHLHRRVLHGALVRLERSAVKVARCVLRGLGEGDLAWLPGAGLHFLAFAILMLKRVVLLMMQSAEHALEMVDDAPLFSRVIQGLLALSEQREALRLSSRLGAKARRHGWERSDPPTISAQRHLPALWSGIGEVVE